MELYLDTSDVEAVKSLARIFPLAGVTTNPSIVAAGKKPLEVLLPELYDAMGGQGQFIRSGDGEHGARNGQRCA